MFKLFHLPASRDISVGDHGGYIASISTFETIQAANNFLDKTAIYFLPRLDAYIAYDKSDIEDRIKIPVEDFISSASGYLVQRCEIDIMEIP